MSDYIMAQQNGRSISGKDKIFDIGNQAKIAVARDGKENVANATIGALLSDQGDLIVLSSVVEVLRSLKPVEFAEYAPIAGTAEYLSTVKKAVFGSHIPEGFIESVATPGGTGAIHNAISNYTCPGDKILTSDWHWSPYQTIAGEIGRSVVTYSLFDEKGAFNSAALEEKLMELLKTQDQTLVIINTPAHNPTGYTFTLSDWDQVISILKRAAVTGKQISLLVDVAYLDFSGDADQYREFMPKLSGLPQNILTMYAFSTSKGYTLYGMRCGALLCVAPTAEIAAEFKKVCTYSCRAAWSNCSRPSMTVLARIFADEDLFARVKAEREEHLAMLIRRGSAFMKAAREADLVTCPFDSGFFISVPCDHPDEAGAQLQKDNIFTVPLGKGLRVSIASISEAQCAMLPAKMAQAIK